MKKKVALVKVGESISFLANKLKEGMSEDDLLYVINTFLENKGYNAFMFKYSDYTSNPAFRKKYAKAFKQIDELFKDWTPEQLQKRAYFSINPSSMKRGLKCVFNADTEWYWESNGEKIALDILFNPFDYGKKVWDLISEDISSLLGIEYKEEEELY
jgi:PKD repeat protein